MAIPLALFPSPQDHGSANRGASSFPNQRWIQSPSVSSSQQRSSLSTDDTSDGHQLWRNSPLYSPLSSMATFSSFPSSSEFSSKMSSSFSSSSSSTTITASIFLKSPSSSKSDASDEKKNVLLPITDARPFHPKLAAIPTSQFLQSHASEWIRYATFNEYTDLATHALFATAVACPSYLQSWSCRHCQNPFIKDVENIKMIDNYDMAIHAYILYHPTSNSIIVAFRGSYNSMSWKTNFQAQKSTYSRWKDAPNAQVHTGFYKAIESERVQLHETVRLYLEKHPNANIFIVGHSLGGALATLYGIDLALTVTNWADIILHTPIQVRAYESPRIGNPSFANAVHTLKNLEIWRTVNEDDTIPHTPPTWLDYQHVGTEFWIRKVGHGQYKNGIWKCRSDLGEDPLCSASLKAPIAGERAHIDMFGIRISKQCKPK